MYPKDDKDKVDCSDKQELTITCVDDEVHISGFITFDVLVTVVQMLQDEVRRVLGLEEHETDKKEYVQ